MLLHDLGVARDLSVGANLHLGAALCVASAAVHATIPPVLDGVVAASAQATGNLSPSLAHLGNHLLNHLALLGSDGVVVEVRLEVLVVALTALLGRTRSHHAGNAHPVVGTLGMDQSHEHVVLMLGPGTSLVGRHVDDEA